MADVSDERTAVILRSPCPPASCLQAHDGTVQRPHARPAHKPPRRFIQPNVVAGCNPAKQWAVAPIGRHAIPDQPATARIKYWIAKPDARQQLLAADPLAMPI